MTIKSWLLSLVAVLIGWIGVQAAVMRVSDAAPGAIALFPADDFVSHLPANAAVVGTGRYWVAVQHPGPDLGAQIYAAGAWLVLPAGLPGCLPLTSVTQAKRTQ